ncbi:MAG: DUF6384 family protein [Planctomycetota bacterium]
MSHAQAQATRSRSDAMRMPGQDLTLKETLRVMDVAREMRERRETAEQMFRRDDLRTQLRDKLLRTARLSGDTVTEAEIDAAISQYMETLHTYQEPEAGFQSFLAHCWVWRRRILAGTLIAAAAIAGILFLAGPALWPF